MAFLSYLFYRDARRTVENNLFRVLRDPIKVKKITRQVFLNYGIYLADWAKLFSVDTKKAFSRFNVIRGEDVIKRALERKKGIILLTAHLGNWELGGVFFSYFNLPINIVTGRDEVQAIADVRKGARIFHNIKTITVGDGSFSFIEIVNALRGNEIVAMLVDRYDREGSVLVDFFGESAYFPVGPVLLARMTGAAVIPAFTIMEPDGNYRAVADSIIDMEFSNEKQKDVLVNLKKIVKVFEKYINKYASQWYNFSPIWHNSKDRL